VIKFSFLAPCLRLGVADNEHHALEEFDVVAMAAMLLRDATGFSDQFGGGGLVGC